MRPSKIFQKWPYFALTAVVTALFFGNFVPGTFLTGWDNLHPEFNFKPNIIDRSLWSTWQEYQGLGVRAGNAHAADLLHQLFLYVLSFFMELNLLRYSYHFLALWVGIYGAFELLRRKLLPKIKPPFLTDLPAFLGSLFYLLNLGTLQYFYVPYEAFSHFWASLPWLLLALLSYLDGPNKKTLLFLATANLLAIPAFYIPTLFVVYGLVLAIVFTFNALQRKTTKTAFIALFTVFAINAYWLLPFVGFVTNGTSFVEEVKINRMFTAEAFLRNQKFGGLADVALLKGFLFDTTDLTSVLGSHDFIMRPWLNFLAIPLPATFHYFLFVAVLIGFIWAVRTRLPRRFLILSLFGLTIFALINDNPPTGALFTLLQNTLPLFKQVFRFPYTKFIALASLTYAIGLAYFSVALISLFRKRPVVTLSLGLALTFGLIYANLPSFQGNFFYSPLRQKIPDEYFALFKFFQSQPSEAKIANLPQPTFWGWIAYDWGYYGSGFPWYGIAQPILDRAFDVWNRYNEAYYRDLSRAIYTEATPEALSRVLARYDITFVWLDERVIMPDKPTLLALSSTKKLLASPKFAKVFSSGKQTVYRYQNLRTNHAVGLSSTTKTEIFPFGDLDKPNGVVKVTSSAQELRLSARVPAGVLSIPGTPTGPMLFTTQLKPTALTFSPLLPTLSLNGQNLVLSANPTTVTLSAELPNKIWVINQTPFDPANETPVVLSPKGNRWAVYAPNPRYSFDLGTKLYQQPLTNCTQNLQTAATIFGKDASLGNVLPLFGKASHPCVYGRLSELLPNNSFLAGQTGGLIGFTLNYQRSADEVPSLCLSKEGDTACFYESNNPGEAISTSERTVHYLVPLGDLPLSQIWVKLELSAGTNLRRLTLKDFRVSFYSLLTQGSFNLAPLQQDLNLTLAKETDLTVSFAKNLFPTEALVPGNFTKTKQNCYALGRGTLERRIATDPEVGKYVRYEATDASSCDQFSFVAPPLSVGALTQVTTRNLSGRPIKACLAIEPPGFCLFEEILYPASKNWQTVGYFSPPLDQIGPFQYFLNLDNYAVGPEKRINDVATVTLTAIPYDWLTAISLRQPQGRSEFINPELLLPPTAFSVTHPNPTFYQINLPTQAQASTLNLNEAFDPGWWAWDSKTKQPLKHALINNWANGWVLPAGAGTIVIFFLPQLLEWLGFLLLPLPFFIALRSN